MQSIIDFVTTQVLPHSPFFGALIIAMMVGQVVKTNIFPKDYSSRKPKWFFSLGRKTLALHPILAGAVVGLIWRNPEASISSLPASIAYFATAGALSVTSYEILKGLLKKQGVDIELPGVDE